MDQEQKLEEICIDQPHERDRVPEETQAIWPEGWWAVSDGQYGYIAFFAHDEDACAFASMIRNMAQCGADIAKRYEADKEPEKQYGVYDKQKKRWCPRKPMDKAAADKRAEAYNVAHFNRGLVADRYEARLLPI